jgi:hypothetical protein
MINMPLKCKKITEECGLIAPVRCALAYDPADPYAVTAVFQNACHHEPVIWEFSRELLAMGVVSPVPVGMGDIRIWQCSSGDVHIALSTDEGDAHLHCRSLDLEDFLDQAYTMVPIGKERMDIDWSEFLPEQDAVEVCHRCGRNTCICRGRS